MGDTAFSIIKDSPPPTRDRRGRVRQYPWDEMEVGDAFDVPLDGDIPDGKLRYPTYNRVTAAASSKNLRERAKQTGVRFTCRQIEVDGKRVVRVWKVVG